jgi:hypothetical protein
VTFAIILVRQAIRLASEIRSGYSLW